MNYINHFNHRIENTFLQGFKISLRNPAMAMFLMKTIRRQRNAAALREEWHTDGVHVPPVMIVSITHRCNLRCKGCYANVFKMNGQQELTSERFEDLLWESTDLGISVIFLAGGEPLLRKDIMEITGRHKQIIFPFFTNGTLIDDQWLAVFNRQKNLIPIISLEGKKEQTDERRGKGVYDMFRRAAGNLKHQGFFWGVSFTLTSKNFDTVLDKTFLTQLLRDGCRMFFFIEYVPVEKGTEDLTISPEQRASFLMTLNEYRTELPGLFIAFPGDEEQYGGCLAAGRGFIHINPMGKVEPCPFAPYSDTDLNKASLMEALSSDFLETIRENHDKLTETAGGCALWQHKEWVAGLLEENSIYRLSK